MVTEAELLAAAVAAQHNAYAPYSRFKVGAAILMDNGRVHTGCNVENASFSHTCCAERTAVFKAVSEGDRVIVGVAIVTDTSPPASPCGSCRQVLWEFGPDAWVLYANPAGEVTRATVRELLPAGFDAGVVHAAMGRGR